MQKIIIIIALAALIITACSDKKSREKDLLNEVIKYHDKVMVADGIIMQNKMKLKNAAAHSLIPGVKDSAAMYSKRLDSADDLMMAWMNKFNPDLTGKSHDEIMTYLTVQKQQIISINAQLNTAIAASGKYLLKIKAK